MGFLLNFLTHNVILNTDNKVTFYTVIDFRGFIKIMNTRKEPS